LSLNSDPQKDRFVASLGANYSFLPSHVFWFYGSYRQEPYRELPSFALFTTYSIGFWWA
jgi:hypothetical protein